jgi:hypothetical protein
MDLRTAIATLALASAFGNYSNTQYGGRTIFVGPQGSEGQVSSDGSSIDRPLTSLFGANGALAKLRNRQNRGDRIIVLPGFSYDGSTADFASHVGTASYFTIEAWGYGASRPTVNWTAAAATWLFDTAGVRLINFNLNLCGSSASSNFTTVTPITVTGVDCGILGCTINWGLDTNTGCGSTLGAIALVGAHRFQFIGNRCENLDTAGTLAVSLLSIDGCNSIHIDGNTITGGTTSTTVGPIHFVTTASTNVYIGNNRVENLKASSTKAITSAIAGVTGTIEFNFCRVQSGILAYTIATTPFLCSFRLNYTADADTLNGALDVAGGTAT